MSVKREDVARAFELAVSAMAYLGRVLDLEAKPGGRYIDFDVAHGEASRLADLLTQLDENVDHVSECLYWAE